MLCRRLNIIKTISLFCMMKAKVLTLFGEEIIPEQLEAVGKSRAVKKKPEDSKIKKAKEEVAEISQEDKLPQVNEALKDDKQYYSIGEVATMFKVKTSHIRFWTNEFALKVRTTRKGDRLYTPEQVRELRTIYHLVKEKGHTINGAKAKLKSRKKVGVQSIDLKDSLLQLRNKLLGIRNQLK